MDKDRIYGHAELALLYFKNIQPKSASTQLARWIRRDEELWEELLLAGYRKGKLTLKNALMGVAMGLSGGKANPVVLQKLMDAALDA